MLARDWDIRITPLQGLGGLWRRLTWAFARRTRSSPGCHMADLRPWQISGLVARGNLVLASASDSLQPRLSCGGPSALANQRAGCPREFGFGLCSSDSLQPK